MPAAAALAAGPSWHCACGLSTTKVLDSRANSYGIRRRRQCAQCGARFTTAERFDSGGAITLRDAEQLAELLERCAELRDALARILRTDRRFRGGVLSPGAMKEIDQ